MPAAVSTPISEKENGGFDYSYQPIALPLTRRREAVTSLHLATLARDDQRQPPESDRAVERLFAGTFSNQRLENHLGETQRSCVYWFDSDDPTPPLDWYLSLRLDAPEGHELTARHHLSLF